jgi:hypothetical protein
MVWRTMVCLGFLANKAVRSTSLFLSGADPHFFWSPDSPEQCGVGFEYVAHIPHEGEIIIIEKNLRGINLGKSPSTTHSKEHGSIMPGKLTYINRKSRNIDILVCSENASATITG